LCTLWRETPNWAATSVFGSPRCTARNVLGDDTPAGFDRVDAL
jgi:hypothetical protein